jgi:TolB-like protein/predicted Ser/Thr protein kinase/Tfp pilus assembly protein PilF
MAEIRAVHEGEHASDSPIMSSVPRICRKCGAEIFADAPEGLCTACLFEAGLGLLTDASVAESDLSAVALAKADDPCPDDGVPLLHAKKKSDRSKTFADFGDYELLEEIGRGGQGVVYRARQKNLNRTVALKVIGLGHWATDAHLKRFRREAEAAASLDHSGIVPIYEVGERGGSCYFSMKLVEGGQLDAVTKHEPMPIRQAVELIAKVARTVHYAHEHGILHRDIKPGNILLDGKGEPHLTDFGLARLVESESTVTRTMEVLGTPSYMAPEQAVGNNGAISNATDVYGLGAVLYQLLTGHPPFAGGTTYETIKLLLDTEPRQPRLWNSKIDRDLSTICLKSLEKDIQRRYSSALALAEDLDRWLKHEPIQARRTGVFARARKWVRRNPTSALLAASLVALAAAAAWIVWKSEFVYRPVTTGIAVLPFENLDGDKEHAFFADGIQDDILTKLAKVADLKVISRTSVMPYRGARNTRQIGDALRVSHVLEGSVQRAGGKVRVNAQLIDTRSDTHVWAEQYDRDLADVFAIQTEIAQKITDQLQAKMSSRERAAIEEQPTQDLVAYDLYVRATSLIDKAAVKEGKEQEKDYFQAIELLNQAIARDPAFLFAYCRLAGAHDELYMAGTDQTPSRLELANAAINSAFRLKPDSAEAHLALAVHLYHGYFDYDRARDELAIALRTLPNDARIFEWGGYIDRRQRRWYDAVRNFARATELDPRNVKILSGAAGIYHLLRDYKRETEALDRLVALEPNNIDHRLTLAWLDVRERANTRAIHALLEKIAVDNPELVRMRLNLALYDRDTVAADRALAVLGALGEDIVDGGRGGVQFTRAYEQALVARIKGDVAAAHAAFIVARAEQEKAVSARPDYGPLLCVLGLIDAGLGRKEDAQREGRRALDLAPMAKDSSALVVGGVYDYAQRRDLFDDVDVLYVYAMICAWTGERDLALEQLETVAKIPAGPSYGELRLNPIWDPLRGDPRFEKIVQSLAPK